VITGKPVATPVMVIAPGLGIVIVAQAGLLLLQVPPLVASVRQQVFHPVQTVEGPVMPAGTALTVMGFETAQLVGKV